MASRFKTSVKLNTNAMSVDVSIIDKETDETVDTGTFPASGVHDNLKPQVGLYGLSKLLQDRCSDTPTGPEKLVAMQGVMAQLTEGRWAKERVVGAAVVSAAVEALAQIKGLTVPQTQAVLKGYPKENRQKILANPKVVELAEQIAAARADDQAVASASFDDLVGEEAAA